MHLYSAAKYRDAEHSMRTEAGWCGSNRLQHRMITVTFNLVARVESPFPQIDIIGAKVIVWRVRGKIIRSVLCNIVCNNCAQCNGHTYEQI